ncbi:hypothetical protein UlMin_010283 [Ulmus minor]
MLQHQHLKQQQEQQILQSQQYKQQLHQRQMQQQLMQKQQQLTTSSSLSNAGNVGQQQMTGIVAPAQSLAIGTPGISASPLLTEFSGPDGTHGNALASLIGKSNITEQPLDRLIKASIAPNSLSSAVSDIGSVVSMTDRIAGSAPGNGSKAAVGEDLVAMTNCRLQVRNFMTQDRTNGTRKMKRYTSAMPLNVVSSAGSITDSFKQLNGVRLGVNCNI